MRKTWEIILLAIWHDPCKGILPNPQILGEKFKKFEKRIFFGKAVSLPLFTAEHQGKNTSNRLSKGNMQKSSSFGSCAFIRIYSRVFLTFREIFLLRTVP